MRQDFDTKKVELCCLDFALSLSEGDFSLGAIFDEFLEVCYRKSGALVKYCPFCGVKLLHRDEIGS